MTRTIYALLLCKCAACGKRYQVQRGASEKGPAAAPPHESSPGVPCNGSGKPMDPDVRPQRPPNTAPVILALLCCFLLCGCEAVGYTDGAGKRFFGAGLFTKPDVSVTVSPDGTRSIRYQRSNDVEALGAGLGTALRAYSGGLPTLTPTAAPFPVAVPGTLPSTRPSP